MNNTIILASASPRRKDILTEMKLPFTVMPSSYDEITPDHLPALEIPEFFARNKVTSLSDSLTDADLGNWVLGADTAIVFNGSLIGKPADRSQAEYFIRSFAGHTHQVVSGIAVLKRDTETLVSCSSVSNVTVKEMSDQEVSCYLDTEEWQGVAGAYRIQESFSRFISDISGSYSGIIGLPISELYDILKTLQYPVLESLQP